MYNEYPTSQWKGIPRIHKCPSTGAQTSQWQGNRIHQQSGDPIIARSAPLSNTWNASTKHKMHPPGAHLVLVKQRWFTQSFTVNPTYAIPNVFSLCPTQPSGEGEEPTGLAYHHCLSGHLLLFNCRDLQSRVQALRARFRTVHDSVAPVQLEWVVQCLQPLLREFIPTVCNPPAHVKMQN